MGVGGIDRSARVYEFLSSSPIWTLSIPAASAGCLAFSPDNLTLAVATSYAKEFYLYSMKTGKLTATLRGHMDAVRDVAFLPDGSRIISSSGDGTLRIWDTSSGEWVATLLAISEAGEAPGVDWIAYTPEGYFNGSRGIERYVRWEVEGKHLPGDKYSNTQRDPSRLRRIVKMS